MFHGPVRQTKWSVKLHNQLTRLWKLKTHKYSSQNQMCSITVQIWRMLLMSPVKQWKLWIIVRFSHTILLPMLHSLLFLLIWVVRSWAIRRRFKYMKFSSETCKKISNCFLACESGFWASMVSVWLAHENHTPHTKFLFVSWLSNSSQEFACRWFLHTRLQAPTLRQVNFYSLHYCGR